MFLLSKSRLKHCSCLWKQNDLFPKHSWVKGLNLKIRLTRCYIVHMCICVCIVVQLCTTNKYRLCYKLYSRLYSIFKCSMHTQMCKSANACVKYLKLHQNDNILYLTLCRVYLTLYCDLPWDLSFPCTIYSMITFMFNSVHSSLQINN